MALEYGHNIDARLRALASRRGLRLLSLIGIALFGFYALAVLQPARAVEAGASNQYTPCFLCGIATGALPPPGWYFQNTTIDESLTGHDGAGRAVPIKLSVQVDVPQLVWVPNIPQVMGATYAVSLLEPLTRATVDVGGGASFSRNGVADTVFVPALLAWNLSPVLYASTSVVFYVPDGSYNAHAVLNLSDNYWTFEPSAAVSYVGHQLDLTLHAALDINTQDRASRTTTGDILILDLTATRGFGAWEFGVVGNWTQQLTRDVGPSAAGNEMRIALGPLIGRRFGPMNVQAFAVREIVTRNAFGGNTFWLRVFLPLGVAAKT
jgi:hypothetical protein